ncbi:hypothetical protein DQ04_06421000 [Trypanosoma grayi]|uniref:hypothetical protein n=1 Tax=Trypanosoma grayi TaxID=71804 RepID=UPI0004F42894|nr:hypothetical protein DQ04_06421000 [Trypanosoma grayi]KEG08804.1 hypothetical protein DQ04_06421000 [Trypanosoma grayi]
MLFGVVLLLAVFGSFSCAMGGSAEEMGAHAVYRLSVANDTLISKEHVVCMSEKALGWDTQEAECDSGVGRLVRRLLIISTYFPPGIVKMQERLPGGNLDECPCLNFACEDGLNDGSVSQPGFLGLAVGSPCCGSMYSTFVLDVAKRTLVQSMTLPTLLGSNPLGFSCLLRQSIQGMMPLDEGGLSFSVSVYLCHARISNIISERDGRTLMEVLTAVISTNEAVMDLLLPREVLRAISGWLAAGPAATSLYDAGHCSFVRGPGNSRSSSHSRKEYLECKISPEFINHLPELEFSVQTCRYKNTFDMAYRTSVLYVDMNRMVDADGYLRIQSSGSITESLEEGGKLPLPKVVFGALFLENAVFSVTRYVRPGSAVAGFPMMLMEVARQGPPGNDGGEDGPMDEKSCAVPKTCRVGKKLFTSLNRCGASPDCGGIISHHYHPDTLECEVSLEVIGALGVLSLLFIATDVAILLLRWRVEKMTMSAASGLEMSKVK